LSFLFLIVLCKSVLQLFHLSHQHSAPLWPPPLSIVLLPQAVKPMRLSLKLRYAIHPPHTFDAAPLPHLDNYDHPLAPFISHSLCVGSHASFSLPLFAEAVNCFLHNKPKSFELQWSGHSFCGILVRSSSSTDPILIFKVQIIQMRSLSCLVATVVTSRLSRGLHLQLFSGWPFSYPKNIGQNDLF
jgi:hypothetical protein